MSQQIRERQLRVLSPPTVHYVFGDERTQSQTLIQLAHQKQTTVGGDARTLEIHFQMGVKRELKWLILFLTDWIEPPQSSFYSQSRMNTGVGAIIQPLTQSSKRKFGIKPESCGPGCSSSGPLKLAFWQLQPGFQQPKRGREYRFRCPAFHSTCLRQLLRFFEHINKLRQFVKAAPP
jgi:hypothetical protein